MASNSQKATFPRNIHKFVLLKAKAKESLDGFFKVNYKTLFGMEHLLI